MSSFPDPSEGTITLKTPVGKWAVGPIVPAVSSFSGVVTSPFGATFDYAATFQCDIFGYRTNTPDLAWIEFWATDHAQSNFFYAGKTKALEIPMSQASGPPFPTYSGSWKGLGAGRNFDLYVKYRLTSGDESQYSAAVASNITNSGVGMPSLAMNSSAPTVTGSTFFSMTGQSCTTGNYQIGVNVTNPAATGNLRGLAVYLVPHGGPAPVTGTLPWSVFPFQSSASYVLTLSFVPFQLPVAAGGPGGWDLYVAWEDQSGNFGPTTQIVSIPAVNATYPIFVNTIGGDSVVNGVPVLIGSGAPSGAPPTSPALYINTAGTAGTASILYWYVSSWTNIL